MENVKTELLAPAGSLEILRAAVNAGADAVYTGGNLFSARAYAANFSEEELISGIRYAHLHGAKVHLAVNTLLKNTEISALYDYLRPIVFAGLDAVIVQDIGVISVLRREFPNLEIHASTQCTVTDIYGLRFFADMGVKRVVLSRELSIQEISAIVKAADSENIETEVFVHGALCYSYSGLCLMSSIIGGRSGNRGRCAQTCRLPFLGLSNPDKKHSGDRSGYKEQYPLSLKDYNGAYNLDKLIDTGVTSLKIEGRMKSAGYVYGVTSIYRRLIDEYYEKGTKPDDKDIKALDALGSRGGNTPGYPVFRNGREMVTLNDSSHRSEKTENSKITENADTGIHRIPVTGTVSVICNEEVSISLSSGNESVKVSGGMALPAEKAPVDESFIREKISALGNTFFLLEKLDINMPREAVFISAKELKDLKRKAVSELEKKLFAENDSSFEISLNTDHKNSAQKQQTHIVAESLSQIETALEMRDADIVFICAYAMDDSELKKSIKLVKDRGISAGIALPQVFREKRLSGNEAGCSEPNLYERSEMIRIYKDFGADFFLVRNFGGIKACIFAGIPADRIYADHSIYTWNNESLDYLRGLGIKHFTAPLELNAKELSHRDNHDSSIVSGALYPLMVSAGCVQKTLKKCDCSNAQNLLTDRMGKRFKVKSYCGECMNVLYNSIPTVLSEHTDKLERLGFEAVRYDLCGMDDDMVKALFSGKLKEITGGHFQRGVK